MRLHLIALLLVGVTLMLAGGVEASLTTKSVHQDDFSGKQIQFINVYQSGFCQPTASARAQESASHGVNAWMNLDGRGLRLRITTTGGQPRVPVVCLTSEINFDNQYDLISQALSAGGYTDPNKLYVAYYDGPQRDIYCSVGRPGRSVVIAVENCYAETTPQGFTYTDVAIIRAIFYSWGLLQAKDTNDIMLDPIWAFQNGQSLNWKSLNLLTDSEYGALASSPFFEDHVVVTTVGNGKVTPSPAADVCSLDCGNGLLFPGGTNVTFTATPAAGWAFAGWSGVFVGNDPSYSRVVDAEFSLTATFKKIAVIKVTLHVSPLGSGKIVRFGRTTQVFSVTAGTAVTLKAVANKGRRFDHWSVNTRCGKRLICTFKVMRSAAVTAFFK